MYEDEVVVDDALVRELVATQFPHWSRLPLAGVTANGNVNALFRLGTDLVARLPRVPWGQANLEREVEWLPRLARRLPVRIPIPVANGEPDGRYPMNWAVYSWIDGEVLEEAAALDVERVARELAATVRALRRVPLSGPPGYRGHDLATCDHEVRGALAVIDGAADTRVLADIWARSLRAPRWSSSPVWTHGDLLPGNVLVRGDHLAGLIDFGCAGIGDPACDVMAAWTLFTGDSREAFRQAVDADEATWVRGRGWALSIGVVACAYFAELNPSFAAMGRRILDDVVADL